MADRGFDKSKDLAFRGTTLCIPPFTKGKSQLSQWEVEMSRALSSLRIHVERAMGELNITRSYNTHFQYRYSKILMIRSLLLLTKFS